MGHVRWVGHVYGTGPTQLLGSVCRIYHGIWGTSPFQALYRQPVELWQWIPAMPEWYLGLLACSFLVIIWALGARWHPLLLGFPLASVFAGIPVALAFASARKARYPSSYSSRRGRAGLILLTTILHMLQPIARLSGRFQYGIRPWRWRARASLRGCWPRTEQYWSETWRALEDILPELEEALARIGVIIERGQVSDAWDLRVKCSLFGSAQIHSTVEEHGAGKQMFRFRIRPRVPAIALILAAFFAVLSCWALLDRALIESTIMLAITMIILCRIVIDCGYSIGSADTAVQALAGETVRNSKICLPEAISPLRDGAVPR